MTAVAPRRMLGLAASAFVVLAAGPTFLLVDTAVVGHLGRVDLAALGAAATVMAVLAIVGTSMEYGTTARAARFYGARHRAQAVNEGVQATWLALGLGLLAMAIGQVVADPVTRLVAGDDAVAEQAANWLRIALMGLPGILVILAGNGWLRGVQDTRTPVRIVVVANAVSIVLSPVLVYPVGWGLEGSAVANVAGQTVGLVLCLRALVRERVPRALDLSVVRRQVTVSTDLVIRSLAFTASFAIAASVAGRMGAAQLAAHQIGLQLFIFTALILDSFAVAAQSLVGAALGSGSAEGARSTANQVGRWGLAAGCVAAALFAAGWLVVPAAFTDDQSVRDQVHVLWPWFVGMLPAAGLVFALDGVLLGAGDNAYIRNITVGSAIIGFIPLALVSLPLGWGLGGVWAGLALFVLLRTVGMVARTRSSRWQVLGTTR